MQHPAPDRRQAGGQPPRYFETVNPATQEVLAEVAQGGADEVNAAVAAAKAAFPTWAGLPATERARLMRKLGELIAAHVPEIARTETQRHRPGDRADRQAAGAARGRQLPLLRRDVHARGRPHLPHAHAPELHAVPPGGRVRADQPVERALHDGHLEGRAGAGLRQHGRAEDERALADDRRAPGRAGAGGRHPGGRAEHRARLRQGGRRAAVSPTPTCAPSRSPAPPPPATASCRPRA